MLVEIAVCLPLLRTFHYESESAVSLGCRVLVPFRNRDVDGFVVGLHRKAPEGLKILPVKAVLDRDSLLARGSLRTRASPFADRRPRWVRLPLEQLPHRQ